MYQILIADDELSLREGLVNFINWNDMNCQVVFVAENGAQAIDYLQKNPVHIVITDIRMPLKTGLEVAEFIKTEGLLAKVIILSGYSDFHYAQKALHLGVVDFILKDNPLEKIKDAVARSIVLIEQEQKDQETLEEMKRSFAQEKEDLQIKFFMDLINEVPIKPDILEKKMETFGTSGKKILCVVFQVQNILPGRDIESAFINAVVTYTKKIFSSYHPIVFPMQSDRILMVLQPAALTEEHHIESHLQKFFDMVGIFTEYRIRTAVSTIQNNILDLNRVYLECSYCLKHHIADKKNLFFYKDEAIHAAPTDNPLIHKAVLHMEKHCQECLTLQDIAAHVGLNPSYFSRLFKQVTGDSVTTFLTKCRIARAKELLSDDSLRLSEIAENTGFNDVSYFSNTFKKLTGYTPSDYRTLLIHEKKIE